MCGHWFGKCFLLNFITYTLKEFNFSTQVQKSTRTSHPCNLLVLNSEERRFYSEGAGPDFSALVKEKTKTSASGS